MKETLRVRWIAARREWWLPNPRSVPGVAGTYTCNLLTMQDYVEKMEALGYKVESSHE